MAYILLQYTKRKWYIYASEFVREERESNLFGCDSGHRQFQPCNHQRCNCLAFLIIFFYLKLDCEVFVIMNRVVTSSDKASRSFCVDSCMSAFFEYETPKVVTVQNVPLGILRLFLQILVISFVVFYQLWYAKGYQEFAEVEASVTTKVKGFSR